MLDTVSQRCTLGYMREDLDQQTSLRLSSELYQELEQRAETDGMTVAQVIRKALRTYLSGEGEQ